MMKYLVYISLQRVLKFPTSNYHNMVIYISAKLWVWGLPSNINMCLRATSHTRLRARDHYT